jgi:hypothetical protein
MPRSYLIFLALTLEALSLATGAPGQSGSPVKPTAKPQVAGSVSVIPTSGFARNSSKNWPIASNAI